MATNPSPPEFDLPASSEVASEAPKSAGLSTAEPPLPGRDALQALLAFSSLHEQIRQRRARNGQPPEESADDFVLYDVLQLVAERALALTGADGVAIALVEEAEIVCRAAAGPIAPDVGVRLDPSSGFSGACFRSGEVVRCDDTENDGRVNVQVSRQLHARSMVAVPLRGRRSVVGLLEAFSTDAYGFNDSDVRSLSLLAELILGAMKPEEEEKLEALSPVALSHGQETAPETTPEPKPEPQLETQLETQPEPQAQVAESDVLEAAEPELVPLPDVSPALFSGYAKPPASRRGLLVAAIVLAVALPSFGGLWWWFNSKGSATPVAMASAPGSAQAAKGASTAAAVKTVADLPQGSPVSDEDANRNVLPVVTGIRHWESGDSTTVVIDLQDQVQYEVHRLSNPERIYFDLHDTVLGPGLEGTTIEVGDALLARIRVAQPMPGISRVVLETKGVSNFSVSLAPNPMRLVAEIRALGADNRPKARIDFVHPNGPSQRNKLTSALGSMTKEDLQLRAHVPKIKVVVDAGHGGWDQGTVGRQGLLEKDLVLEIAHRLGNLLESRLGSEVVYTRDDDTYVALESRAEIANEAQADLFVSVHANYSVDTAARGVETYYTTFSSPANSLDIEKRENATAKTAPEGGVLTGAALKERTDESRRLAASVERSLFGSLAAKSPGIRDRGVKEAGFVVLTGTSMPAVLAEVSFVSSPTDEHNLLSTAYRQQIAEALYRGIARYAAASNRVKLASASGKPGGK